MKEYRIANRERLNEKKRKWYRDNHWWIRGQMTAYMREKRNALRDAVYNKFGNKCKWCGITDKRVLCIDHVHGGGVVEHRSPKFNICSFYRKVLNNESGVYQLLCHNCNWIKRHENKEVPQLVFLPLKGGVSQK